MKIKNLDPCKYKRLFTFGCSFTNYIWPTWSDIIGQDFEFYENWGRPGAGNHYILNAVMECDSKNNFTNDDLVLIMWSNPEREDRYVNNNWLCASIQEKEKIYGKTWVKKFGVDLRGYLIRDLAYIKCIQEFLISKNVDWANFSMYSICSIDEEQILNDGYTYKEHFEIFVKRYVDLNRALCDNKEILEPYARDTDVLDLYKSTYKNIEYSILDVARNGIAYNSKYPNFGDQHCTPIENLQYLDFLYPKNTVSQQARDFAKYWEGVVQSITTRDVLPTLFPRQHISRL